MTKPTLPHIRTPMLATLVEAPFDKAGWIFEVKWDGYRALAYKKNQHIDLISRGEQSFNSRYSTIVEELKKFKGNFILDGEIVALDEKGLSNFSCSKITKKTRPHSFIMSSTSSISMTSIYATTPSSNARPY